MRKRLAILTLIPIALAVQSQPSRTDMKRLLTDVSAAYVKLEPQSIRPAEGFIKYDYLIPAGYYKQMWDWDGFFIGLHLAHQSREKARYLKYWALNFAKNHAARIGISSRRSRSGGTRTGTTLRR